MRGNRVMTKLDIAANRRTQKYGRGELVARFWWSLAQPLFRFSPRPCFAWRCWLLRRFGSHIGHHVRIENTVRIQHPWLFEVGDYAAVGDRALIYNLGKVTIGARATVSQQAHLCAGAHDYTRSDMRLEKQPITIGNDSWVCADAFVGPGVHVGEGAIVGARAAVFKNVESWTIVGGNPARLIKHRELEQSLD
jgi:putative colanic acid biosynthesis acetyltransferase WcaF